MASKGEEIVGAWEENYPPARVVHWYRRIRPDLARRIDEALATVREEPIGQVVFTAPDYDAAVLERARRCDAAEARLALAERVVEAARAMKENRGLWQDLEAALAAWDAKEGK